MVNMKENFERFKKQCQDDKDDAFLKQQDDKDDAFLKCQHIIDELRSSISEGTRVQELEGIRKSTDDAPYRMVDDLIGLL